MIITERDKQIIRYMKIVKYATTRNIAELFFNNGSKNYHIVTLKRMNKLVNNGYLESVPANVNEIGRPITLYYIDDNKVNKRNYRHALAVSNFSAKLKLNGVEIIELQTEIYLSNKIRVDAIYKVIYNGKKRLFLVEFDITKKFNVTKYEYFKKSGEWKDYFKVFPRIVSVTDNKVSYSDTVNIIHLDKNLDNFNTLLELIK